MMHAASMRRSSPPCPSFTSSSYNARQVRLRPSHRHGSHNLQLARAQTQPSFACDVFKLQSLASPADLQLLWKAAQLHSDAFHEPPLALPFLAPVTSFIYSLQSFGLQLMTYYLQNSNHITVMAYRPAQVQGPSSGPSAGASAAVLQQQMVGTANASLRLADDGFCQAIDCKPGTPFIIITNMAVAEPFRGKGVGRQLLTSAIMQAKDQFKPSAELLVLMVYVDNDVAVSLYKSFGFIDTRWVDPRWLRDAEKSRVGKPRRLLLVKQLSKEKP